MAVLAEGNRARTAGPPPSGGDSGAHYYSDVNHGAHDGGGTEGCLAVLNQSQPLAPGGLVFIVQSRVVLKILESGRPEYSQGDSVRMAEATAPRKHSPGI